MELEAMQNINIDELRQKVTFRCQFTTSDQITAYKNEFDGVRKQIRKIQTEHDKQALFGDSSASTSFGDIEMQKMTKKEAHLRKNNN